MSQILHVVVVGFHHKKGCQVEFSYPPLSGSGENGLPDEWSQLPSLALPDGAHNMDSDVIYFVLPAEDREQKEVVFGISCYRQIATSQLLTKSDDITRSSVQKSVCVLSRTPLYGVLKAKLELITQAYFNELDFAKVDVLSQMYTNLCEMFDGDLVDGHAASMDISVQSLMRRFRHRTILLFKLLLLERKVVFNITPVQELGDTMLALISLCPRLLEDGLFYCSSSSESSSSGDSGPSEIRDADDSLEIRVRSSSEILKDDPIQHKDSFGFPLSIFTQGNLFHPYLSISYLDTIRSPSTRAFMVGATNALFVTKKELLDAVVTVDESGVGQVEIISADLKRTLSLTAADLRFGDYLLRNIEINQESSSLYEGGDEWLRVQMRTYLLSMAATARSDLQTSVADFGSGFIYQWRDTRNYQIWMAGAHEDLSGAVPGHSFAGQLGLSDIRLRMEHSVAGSEGARKALTAISATGKNIGETGSKVKQSISTWFRGNQTDVGQECSEGSNRPEREWDIGSWLRPSTLSVGNNSQTTSNQEADVMSQSSQQSISTETQSALSNKVKSLTSWFKSKKSNSVEGAEEATEVVADCASGPSAT